MAVIETIEKISEIEIYFLFGLLPSLIWLFYYLRKDPHPEPQKMVIDIFLWGALITLPVIFVQVCLTKLLSIFHLKNLLLFNLIHWFLVISFSEEFFKYLVVKIRVFNSPHLDEPVDIVLYMIVAALGFAAVENILYIIVPEKSILNQTMINKALLITVIRFISAVFLHTLCSAIVGYFLVVSFFRAKKGRVYVILGILAATLLHGLYNFSIITLEDKDIKLLIPLLIILVSSFFVFSGFKKIKKLKSICKIN